MSQVSQNRPLRDLRNDVRLYHDIGLPLYEASIQCDWKAAEAILNNNTNMNLLSRSITENGETALHIAASANAPKKKMDEFVRNLVMRMEPEDLELVNNYQNTALYLAATAGNIETVKIMMERNPTLDTIPGGGRVMPLYAAVLFGNKDVAKYLFECSRSLKKDGWNDENRRSLLEKCVESDMFDIAYKIVRMYAKVGRSCNDNLLGLLARKPEAFHEKKSWNSIRRTILSGTPVERNYALGLLRILWEDILQLPNREIDDILRGPPDSVKSGLGRIVQAIQLKQLIFSHLDKLNKETPTIMEGTEKVSKLQDLVSKYVADMHVDTQSIIKQENTTDEDQSLELQKLISEYIMKLHGETKKMLANPDVEDEDQARRLQNLISNHIKKMRAETEIKMRAETEIRDTHSSRVMSIAAEVGNTDFLVELIRRKPDLIWQVDDNGLSIFHIAVKHRHEGIYNLLYEIGSMKDMVTTIIDKDENNMLHLAAMRTRKKNLQNVIGAAVQMQREVLWFKEVERMVPPFLREKKNKYGFTPRQLFTFEHQDLIAQGKKLTESTANQCMVVATFIATIVFAAAFTVPGGYNQNDGIPMFKRKLSFVAFVVADAISLSLSSMSILIFFSFYTFRYAEYDFVASLPMKLMLGLATLFLSIAAMMVTFSVSFFVLYHKEMKWIPLFISLYAIMPVILYVALEYHLLIYAFHSTYSGKYLFKPARHVLFYENPKV